MLIIITSLHPPNTSSCPEIDLNMDPELPWYIVTGSHVYKMTDFVRAQHTIARYLYNNSNS